MRIYVGGSRHERDVVRRVQDTLMDFGHTITFDWTGAEGEILLNHGEGHYGEDATKWKAIAEREVSAVKNCDAMVACLSPAGKGRGLYIEMGIAIGLRIPVYLYGDAKRNDSNFYVLGSVHTVDTLDELTMRLAFLHINLQDGDLL